MRHLFTLLLVVIAPVATMAQTSACSEQGIRDAILNHTVKVADDAFFWSGAHDKPVIESAEKEEAAKKTEAEAPRKNPVADLHPQRIVVSNSGDMAYEYGRGEVSYDLPKTGKHVSFQAGYLRVWRAIDGECKVSAHMMRAIGSTHKSN
jgi:hypothetical protein